jgi:hypothetical protein
MDFLLFFAGFVAGVGVTLAFNVLVQRQATSLYMQAKGARGNAVKQEKDSELMVMLSEAMAKFNEAKEQGADIKQAAPKILIEVAAAHPLGALRFGGQLKKLVEQNKGLFE